MGQSETLSKSEILHLHLNHHHYKISCLLFLLILQFLFSSVFGDDVKNKDQNVSDR